MWFANPGPPVSGPGVEEPRAVRRRARDRHRDGRTGRAGSCWEAADAGVGRWGRLQLDHPHAPGVVRARVLLEGPEGLVVGRVDHRLREVAPAPRGLAAEVVGARARLGQVEGLRRPRRVACQMARRCDLGRTTVARGAHVERGVPLAVHGDRRHPEEPWVGSSRVEHRPRLRQGRSRVQVAHLVPARAVPVAARRADPAGVDADVVRSPERIGPARTLGRPSLRRTGRPRRRSRRRRPLREPTAAGPWWARRSTSSRAWARCHPGC